ncbi:Ead domain protein [Klebsiella quasipneumoniae]|uniref:hypothetical protein n=1 Tax=Klebsiella TaxID=570 RepID=UPI0009BA4792|nr:MULTISPECIES: hypothetical protein [Klebsiella]SLR06784.1 Ead domain protein [Klebsiella quasipneumoniae]VUT04455.1 hypothetical protein SB6415_02111 [Klebsiella pasteurii]HBR1596273.1 hypothetical protein [Klebsiella quasipneumoniae subsp. quasipneumoniae]
MTTDITELAQRMKAAAIDAKELAIIARYSKGRAAAEKFYALANPNNIIALVEALEKAQATEAHCNRGWSEAHEQEARAEAAEKRIAELESRTVKLPKIRRVKLVSGEYVNGWTAYDVACALSAVGIKVEAE